MKTGKHWIGGQNISGIDLPLAPEETCSAFSFLTKKTAGSNQITAPSLPSSSPFPVPLHHPLAHETLPGISENGAPMSERA